VLQDRASPALCRGTARRRGSPEKSRGGPARTQDGGVASPLPPRPGGSLRAARERRERAVICGAVEVGELDVGHGREGDVV
jgi:hypothetical protein